jgi:hypothetical protein
MYHGQVMVLLISTLILKRSLFLWRCEQMKVSMDLDDIFFKGGYVRVKRPQGENIQSVYVIVFKGGE